MLSEDDGGHSLLVDGLTLDVLLQEIDEVVVGRLDAGRQRTAVDGADVKPAQGGE